jgi:hypothetical protein
VRAIFLFFLQPRKKEEEEDDELLSDEADWSFSLMNDPCAIPVVITKGKSKKGTARGET